MQVRGQRIPETDAYARRRYWWVMCRIPLAGRLGLVGFVVYVVAAVTLADAVARLHWWP